MLPIPGVTGTAIATSKINEYLLEGGAIIRDKTNGMAHAVFLEQKGQKSRYSILINGKKLVFPICSNPTDEPNITLTQWRHFIW